MEEFSTPQTATEKTIIYPSLTERIKSTFIDFILILFLFSITGMLLDNFDEVPDWLRATLLLSLFYVYEPVAQTFGCTLGNYIMGIRVRKQNAHDRRINIAQAYVRLIFKTLLSWFSFFTINKNPRRRAIHDLASGTVILYAED
ncbi:MAG: RDD family protein [Cytophaga sp.]|uniref:RDD family protein n=1 Tax=Cytophaga sp. TaxID=29535 RepID=UPI003F8198BA